MVLGSPGERVVTHGLRTTRLETYLRRNGTHPSGIWAPGNRPSVGTHQSL